MKFGESLSADGLPPLRQVIERHGLAARKALGQNFLLDLNITAKIARIAGPLVSSTVIEVGPGPGGLTRALLAAGAREVIVIERDERCLPALVEIAEYYPSRLTIIPGDALETNFSDLVQGKQEVKIVANLPYNIGTELLTGWLTSQPWPPYFSSLTLMFQAEVARRVVAQPGTANYGRLSVLAGWRSEARIAFELPPQAFSPPPKVNSAVVHLVPREKPLPCDLGRLETVTRAAFGQRRKMLRQSLKGLGGESLLSKAEIEPTRRAETLSIEEFASLANALAT